MINKKTINKKTSYDYNNWTSEYKALACISIIFAFFANTSLVNNLTSVYYGISILLLIIIMFKAAGQRKLINLPILFLYIACILSFVINQVPPIFRSFERFMIFFSISTLLGPFISSSGLSFFRLVLFKYFILFTVFISNLSFFLMTTGIYKGGVDVGDVFLFSGLFQGSMVLSPMAGISIIVCYYYYVKTNIKRNKIILILLMISSFLAIIIGGSRSALLSVIFAFLIFIFSTYQFNIQKISKILFSITVILVVTFPLWQSKTAFLMNKFDGGEERGSITASRDDKWNQRVAEFNSSPIYGIGFASIDTKGQDNYDADTGTIEPGSSWMALLSMTGLLGFIPVLIVYLTFMKKLYTQFRITKDLENVLIISILALFSIHQIFEGYFLAAGSLLFYASWLVLGTAQAKLYKHSKF